jgi:predicted nucleic acid-binding protein
MILVDTSVWTDHFRTGNEGLIKLLDEGLVYIHPFIIGELACGNLKNREEILDLLKALPLAEQAEHEEVLQFLQNHSLAGTGIGWIDAHLLTSTALTKCRIWTMDQPLSRISCGLQISL